MPLKELRDYPRGGVPELHNAYRYLRGAHKSVSGLLDVAQSLSDSRRASNPSATGRMAQEEVDVLRSALVFTSSGLDASMKRAVNDVGRYLIPRAGTGAQAQYRQYLKQELSSDSVDANLKNAVIANDATGQLLKYYLAARTKASFQGSGDLRARACGALGISDKQVPEADLKALDSFFKARNSIVHSMDYDQVSNPTSRARIHRSVTETTAQCDRVFTAAADIMHAAADVILVSRRS